MRACGTRAGGELISSASRHTEVDVAIASNPNPGTWRSTLAQGVNRPTTVLLRENAMRISAIILCLK